ncbi:MAG: hypothetical protein AB2448_08075 [Moorella sp. (in: firmicutes)]
MTAFLPYKEYDKLRRIKNFFAVRELSVVLKNAGIMAREIYRISRRELETKSSLHHHRLV